MDKIKQLNNLLKEVQALTKKIRAQYGNKSVLKIKKETIIETSNKIDTSISSSIELVKSLTKILESDQTSIQNAVKTAIHSRATTAIRPTYSNVVSNKKPANKNRIIIKTENADSFDKQLKEKVSPAKEKVNVTFYKKINNSTCIINTATKEESDRLTEIITKRIPDAKVQQEKLLDPTIVIFRCNNISEQDVEKHFAESYGITPVSITKVTGTKASRIYARCTADLYKLLPADKRIRIQWESLAFTEAVNPRVCKKCNRFGHTEKYCQADEQLINFVNKHKELTCTNCLYSNIAKCCSYKDITSHLTNKDSLSKCALSVDHVSSSKNCPHFTKAVEHLRAKTNFGS